MQDLTSIVNFLVILPMEVENLRCLVEFVRSLVGLDILVKSVGIFNAVSREDFKELIHSDKLKSLTFFEDGIHLLRLIISGPWRLGLLFVIQFRGLQNGFAQMVGRFLRLCTSEEGVTALTELKALSGYVLSIKQHNVLILI